MGNAISTGNSSHVQVLNPVCMPGDLVSGSLLINLLSPVNCTGIYLKISGKEYVHWSEERGSGDSKRTVYYTGGRTLFKHLVPLQSEFIQNMIGQFSFPFTFPLPNNLPGSYTYPHGGLTAFVQYKIKGVVAVEGTFKSNIRSFMELRVVEREKQIERVLCKADTAVKSCCCFNKGMMRMSAYTDGDVYHPGDQVKVFATITNESTLAVKRIVVEIYAWLKVTAEGHSNGGRFRMASQSYPGLTPGQSCTNLEMSMVIPEKTPQQCLGFDIRYFYVVVVRADVRCSVDPVCTIPVGIYERATPPPALAENPANWNPQFQPEMAIVIPEENHPPEAEPLSLNQFDNLAPMQT